MSEIHPKRPPFERHRVVYYVLKVGLLVAVVVLAPVYFGRVGA